MSTIDRRKIYSLRLLRGLDLAAQGNTHTFALCHGCFDVLHIGHLQHLQQAKKIADILIVTITADKYVKKGSGRPIFAAEQRAEMVAALSCVDYVTINNAPDPCKVLRMLKPDFYVKGKDYYGTHCKEFDVANEIGTQLVFTNTDKFSTTELIERLKHE